MRSDWGHEANYLFFDVGPVGVLHGHEGKLAVEVVAYGRSLVEDLGIHTYATTERDIPLHELLHRVRRTQHSHRGWKEPTAIEDGTVHDRSATVESVVQHGDL